MRVFTHGTFSLKFTLEYLGFGPCHYFSEMLEGGQRRFRSASLWLLAGPTGIAVFDGFQSKVDTPACNYWPRCFGR